jgi:rare lipoprotein A (peptidoglycan hydrolase)
VTRSRLLVSLLAIFLAACASTTARKRAGDPREDLITDRVADGPDGEDHRLTGRASWYGDKFHGQQTASGEIYDMNGFTAAHKTLPFHTIVRVTDPLTRKSVVVRINDRGPYVDGRIIDLSRAAAADLGLIRHGVIPVRLEVLRWGDGSRVTDGEHASSD